MPESARWYVIHVAAGSENKVAAELHAQMEKKGLLADDLEILVPKKMISMMQKGVRVQAEDRLLPGYVLIHMDCSLEALHVIRRVPRVIGMLGANAQGFPRALLPEEVDQFMDRLDTVKQAPQQNLSFEIGETVKLKEGPFASLDGVVYEVDQQRSRLKIFVPLFGRNTPVELDFSQVEKT